MGGPTTPYARVATDISDSSASGRSVLTGTAAQGASALGVGTANSPTFSGATINGPAGSFRVLGFQSGGAARWNAYVNNDAETGNNSGSNFVIGRALDAGGGDNPLVINRSSGQTTLSSLGVSGPSYFNGAIQLATFTVSTLPAGSPGALAYASNGRKVGEAAGSGTGVIVYFSNGAWRRLSDDTAVAA